MSLNKNRVRDLGDLISRVVRFLPLIDRDVRFERSESPVRSVKELVSEIDRVVRFGRFDKPVRVVKLLRLIDLYFLEDLIAL